MNAYAAEIVRLFTTQVDGLVEDPTPNANSPLPARFDLILQARAGALLGGSGANYTLSMVAVNDDLMIPQPELVPKGSPFAEEWSAAGGWRPTGRDFVKTSEGEPDGITRYRICIPAGLIGEFHYRVRLVAVNHQVVSFARSNPFVLVPAEPWPPR